MIIGTCHTCGETGAMSTKKYCYRCYYRDFMRAKRVVKPKPVIVEDWSYIKDDAEKAINKDYINAADALIIVNIWLEMTPKHQDRYDNYTPDIQLVKMIKDIKNKLKLGTTN